MSESERKEDNRRRGKEGRKEGGKQKRATEEDKNGDGTCACVALPEQVIQNTTPRLVEAHCGSAGACEGVRVSAGAGAGVRVKCERAGLQVSCSPRVTRA